MRPLVIYRKIPKISPGAYIFQRPFLRGLFLEGLIFGGACLRREICVSKSIGLTVSFLLCYTLYLMAIFQVQAPGGLIFGGRFNGGFFCVTGLGAYIWRGLYMEGLIFEILRYGQVLQFWRCAAGWGIIFTTGLTIMGSHTFTTVLSIIGSYIFGFFFLGGVRQFFIFTVSKPTGMFVLQMKSKGFLFQSKKWVSS